MTYEELREAVNGIYAYDTGCVSSGIRDERLREAIKSEIGVLEGLEHRKLLARLVIDMHLSPEALEQGYGPEDAHALLCWFDDQDLLIA